MLLLNGHCLKCFFMLYKSLNANWHLQFFFIISSNLRLCFLCFHLNFWIANNKNLESSAVLFVNYPIAFAITLSTFIARIFLPFRFGSYACSGIRFFNYKNVATPGFNFSSANILSYPVISYKYFSCNDHLTSSYYFCQSSTPILQYLLSHLNIPFFFKNPLSYQHQPLWILSYQS